MAIAADQYARSSAGALSRLKAIWSRATKNPRWFVMEALSRFVSVRRAVRLFRRPPRSQPGLTASPFPQVDVSRFVASLSRDGYCEGLNLPDAAVARILRFASEAPCYGDAKPQYGFKYADKAAAQQAAKRVFSQGTYLFLDELQPVVDELSNDPLLMAIAGRYFGTRPLMTGNRLWWVFSAPAADYDASITTSFFHYDKDDYAAVRFFFYLTEVDTDRGPHVVIRGSHVRKRFSQLISFSERTDQEMIDYYGIDNLTTIFGKIGSGFAEDPFCFHKATRPLSGDRLMLEVKYATRDYNIFPASDRAAAASILSAPTADRGLANVADR